MQGTLEGWLRGLKHRTANAAIVKTIRGFESLTFRKVHGKVRWYVYHQANGLLTTGKSEASKVASGLGKTSSRKMETVT